MFVFQRFTRYGADGQVTGDASGFKLAGMFAPKETGKWWVEGEKLCQKWQSWYDGKTLCFTVRRTGKAFISWTRDDGLSGTARIEGYNPVPLRRRFPIAPQSCRFPDIID